MALLFDWWLLDVVVVIACLVAALKLYLTFVFSYWRKRGVPSVEPSFPFGNIGDLIMARKQVGIIFEDIYKQLKGHKFGGVFQLNRPTLVLRDLDTIKSFLVKDFAYFHDRGVYVDEKNDPLSQHLFFMSGQRWKNLRMKLTPTFTSGKMKMMFQTILECGQDLTDCVQDDAAKGNTIDLKDLVARYSTDVIASCAFGIQCNCLANPDAEFRSKGRAFFNPSFLQGVASLLNIVAPSVAALTRLGNTPKQISDFFLKLVRDTVAYREKNNITRNDLMHLMIQLKNNGYVEEELFGNNDHGKRNNNTLKKLTVDEIAAQAFAFFLAGFETSSTTASFCLHELAVNPDIQTRMRNEIDSVLAKHGGQMTYEVMQELEYMDMVVAETLRMYPPAPILIRECTSSFTIPDSGLVVEPGTSVVVPVYALHHDPEYYPDPDRFDPQRFTTEMKSARNQYSYLPFGEGPRICIGMRFGYMQTKVALISLLSRYEVHVSEKTTIPQVFEPKNFTLSNKHATLLKIVNRA